MYRTPQTPPTPRERMVPIPDSPKETLAKSLLLKSFGENQNQKLDGDSTTLERTRA